jgi:hypothetical protein
MSRPGRGHWAEWSFETEDGYHAQVCDGVLYVRDAQRSPYTVIPHEEIVVEIGEMVRVRDAKGWKQLNMGPVCSMLRVRD